MEKEQFRQDVKDLLSEAFKRMDKTVDNFCDSQYKGFESYEGDVSEMDFINALLSMEARNHSAIGCSEAVRRKSKKRIESYKQSIVYNR